MYHSQAVFNCDNCHRLSIAETQSSVNDPESAIKSAGDHLEWLPATGVTQEFPDVPDHIADAAGEATLCMSIGAYRAVGSLARAVVEATCKDKGITTGNLVAKIDALAAAEHVRKHTKDQAHEVRHFGNGMAHGDFADPVTKEDAEEVIELMAEILDEVYQSPARLAKVKAARVAKNAKS